MNIGICALGVGLEEEDELMQNDDRLLAAEMRVLRVSLLNISPLNLPANRFLKIYRMPKEVFVEHRMNEHPCRIAITAAQKI